LLDEAASMMLSAIGNPYFMIFLLTLIPFLELRASIPYGILVAKLPWWEVFILACIANIILGPALYFFLDKVIHLFFFIKPFKRWYHRKIEVTQERIKESVKKYGVIGVGIFIGVPLPGTGVYTGALGSYALNIGYKRFFYATVLGVLIAGIAVTIITLTLGAGGSMLSEIFIKKI